MKDEIIKVITQSNDGAIELTIVDGILYLEQGDRDEDAEIEPDKEVIIDSVQENGQKLFIVNGIILRPQMKKALIEFLNS